MCIRDLDSTCNHSDERLFSTTGNECCCHNSHTAVTLILDCTGRHDAGNTAACADKHWDKRLTRKTELTEDTVEYECDTSHITAAFEESKKNEEYKHLRNKAKNRTYTGYDTFKDKTLKPVCTIDLVKTVLNKFWNTGNPDSVCCGIGSAVTLFIICVEVV